MKIIKQILFTIIELPLAMAFVYSPGIIMVGVAIFIYSLLSLAWLGIIIGIILCVVGIILVSLWDDDNIEDF